MTGYKALYTDIAALTMHPWEWDVDYSITSNSLHGRRLQDNITSNPTFKWSMIAIGCTLGILLIIGLGFLIYYCVKKKEDSKIQQEAESENKVLSPVTPLDQASVGGIEFPVAPPVPQQPASSPFPIHPAAKLLEIDSSYALAPGASPQPPWLQTGSLPPGIRMSQQIPLNFQFFVSNPRPYGSPPYERLVLISSRVNDPMKLASAVLPNVAVIVYDWKNFTFQELVRHIKQVLGSSKVTTIAVIAPGNKPGCVALLEGSTTTPEILQFWKVLSGCLSATPSNGGRRVDLLGCRVVEAPREGAALLRDLWALTAVPFTAADDALGGYTLATFLEDTAKNTISLIGSTIKGLDLYFNRNLIDGLKPEAYAAPLPLGSPSVAALAADTQLKSSAPTESSRETGDVFKRFTDRVAALGFTLQEVFRKYDSDKSGQLTQKQVNSMVQSILPDASTMDVQHFQAMLDIDNNDIITQQEFISALQDNTNIHEKVKAGMDQDGLLIQLYDYLVDNEVVLANYFRQYDKDKSGRLDHSAVSNLVQSIPDLAAEEQKFIIGYLYQSDKNGDGMLTYEELKAVVASFEKKAGGAKNK